MEGICYIFNEHQNVQNKHKAPTSQDYWEYAKKYILNEKLIKRVKDFKLDHIKLIPEARIE